MEEWRNLTSINCLPNHSILTLGACECNQDQALQGSMALLSGVSVNEVPVHQIERALACGRCNQCKVELRVKQVCQVLKAEFDYMAGWLEKFDWYQWDNDVRAERYREQNKQKWVREQMER